MKWTHNFSLITTFLIIFTRAIALVEIRRKMVIRETLFVNFIQNGVIIDTNVSLDRIDRNSYPLSHSLIFHLDTLIYSGYNWMQNERPKALYFKTALQNI